MRCQDACASMMIGLDLDHPQVGIVVCYIENLITNNVQYRVLMS